MSSSLTSSTTHEAPTYRSLLDRLRPRSCLASRPHLNVRTASTSAASLADAQQSSCGSGMRLAPTCSAPSTTSPSLTARTCAASPGAAEDTTKPNCRTSTPATIAAPQIVLDELRDKVLDLGGDAGIGILRQRGARGVHGAVVREAGIPARAVSGTIHGKRSASRLLQDLRSRRVNVAVRCRHLQRGARRAGGRHRALPPADRERHRCSCSSSVVDCAEHRRQGRADGPRLRRIPPQGVPVGSEAPCADWSNQARAGTRDRTRLPVPAIGMSDRHGQAGAGIGPGKHRSRRSPTAGSRSSPNCGPTATKICLRSSTNPGSSCPTSCVGAVIRGRDCVGTLGSTLARARPPRQSSRSGFARSRMSMTPTARTAIRRLLTDDAASYDELSAAEQHLARMLFFSLWPDGGGHESYDAGLVALRREARDA